MTEPSSTPDHWDDRYATIGTDQVSWFQERPAMSLQLLRALDLPPAAPIVDIGGGASTLVDFLVDAGHTDITVVDLSAAALAAARSRVASDAVTWIEADIRTWQPSRAFTVWHDRAAFHFLTDAVEQQHYWSTVHAHVPIGGWVIVGTFAQDGPQACSGLPVQRWGHDALIAAMGSGFTVTARERELHVTPSGGEQPFTWVVAQRTRTTSITPDGDSKEQQ